ncbi:MAG: type II toxin-antitoxin system RelB/DinJ family antitoxin [Gallionella sp.]
MAINAVVRARIDEQIKDEAAAVLAVSDAFRMMLTRVAREGALPFDPLIPNEKTILAMKSARRERHQKSFKSVEDLTADLNADD